MSTTLTPTVFAQYPYKTVPRNPQPVIQTGLFTLPATYPAGGFVLDLSGSFAKVRFLCLMEQGSMLPLVDCVATVTGLTNLIPCVVQRTTLTLNQSTGLITASMAPVAVSTALRFNLSYLAQGDPV